MIRWNTARFYELEPTDLYSLRSSSHVLALAYQKEDKVEPNRCVLPTHADRYGDDGSPAEWCGGLHRRCVQKAHRLVRHPAFCAADFDDIVQELFGRAWPKLRSFDAAKSKPSTFIDRVLRNEAASLIRDCSAAKRDFGRNGPSIDAPICDHHHRTVSLANLLTDEVHRPRLGHPPNHSLIATATDKLLDDCSTDEAQVLRAMMHRPIAEAARVLGVSRQYVYRVMDRVRKRYETTSLDEFLHE